MGRSRPLTMEVLEDRVTPVTFGNPWPDGLHLTLSFAPDSTTVGNQSSVLLKSFNTIASTSTWKTELVRAFQTWAGQANINFGLITDQGQAFGTSGRPQGDSRFGDIRLAGYAMAKETLALASPFDAAAGTWAGDVKFNTGVSFGVGGAGSYDLFTVALHEAGHALGLDHSEDPASVMYDQYLGPRTALSAGDIAGIQALYGARAPDVMEGAAGNGTFASAASLTLVRNGDGTYGIGAAADIGAKDFDIYKFTAPSGGSLEVNVRTTGLSLLTPRLTVYDSWQRAMASASDTNPLSGDLVLKAGSVSGGRTYYIKVEGARSDAFGVGSYTLQTRITPLLSGLVNTLTGVLGGLLGLLSNDNHSNDSFSSATMLPDSATPSRFDYAFQGSVSDSTDVDFYQVNAPVVPAGTPNVMTVMVWGLDARLIPTVTVYDANQKAVAVDVLVNENGTFIVQLANAVSGAAYYVKVAADNPGGPSNVGNYFCGIDFSRMPEQIETSAQGSLDSTQPRAGRVLNVTQTQLFHFVLSGNGSSDGSVRLTIYDQKGQVAGTVTAPRGKFVSLTLTLLPGAYWFKFEALAGSGGSLPTLSYLLRGTPLSDPIGPTPSDTTQSPATPSGGYAAPLSSGSCGSTSADDPGYSWTDTSGNDSSWGSDWYYYYGQSSDPYTTA